MSIAPANAADVGSGTAIAVYRYARATLACSLRCHWLKVVVIGP